MSAWCAGGGRLSTGGITNVHEACAWVEACFTSRAEEIQKKYLNPCLATKGASLIFYTLITP